MGQIGELFATLVSIKIIQNPQSFTHMSKRIIVHLRIGKVDQSSL